jgi:hypothetical protein
MLLQLLYVSICYDHAMSKYYEYVLNDLKVFDGIKEVLIKVAHTSLQKIILLGLKKGKR